MEKTLPISCKYIYSYAVKLMHQDESINIDIDEAIFGHPKTAWLLRDDILHFTEMEEIGAIHMLVYMGCIPCGVGRDSSQAQHIADRLKVASADSICLIPYNTGSHWILTIINEDKNMIYLLDSMGNRNRYEAWQAIVTNGVKLYNASKGNPKGPGFKKLVEIVESDDLQLEKKFGGFIKNQYYGQAQYDEVRSEWSLSSLGLVTNWIRLNSFGILLIEIIVARF